MQNIDLRDPPQGTVIHQPCGRRAWAAWLLKAAGWQLDFHGLPMQAAGQTSGGQTRWVSRGVLIAYPHTSNWDAVIGCLAIWGLGLKLTLWGKASLFKVPLVGRVLRSAGAVPIERTDTKGAVAATVSAMQSSEVYWLGLAPEGTRKRLPGWRTGFYYAALQARVPVGLAYLDWGRKRIGVSFFIELSGNMEEDFARIERYYDGVVGRAAANASPVRPLDVGFNRKDAVVTKGASV